MLTQQIEYWRIFSTDWHERSKTDLFFSVKMYKYMRSKIGVIVLPNCTDTLYQTLELATGRWISPGTPISSNNITDCHDIVEILFKGELNTISIVNHWLFYCTNVPTQYIKYWRLWFFSIVRTQETIHWNIHNRKLLT